MVRRLLIRYCTLARFFESYIAPFVGKGVSPCPLWVALNHENCWRRGGEQYGNLFPSGAVRVSSGRWKLSCFWMSVGGQVLESALIWSKLSRDRHHLLQTFQCFFMAYWLDGFVKRKGAAILVSVFRFRYDIYTKPPANTFFGAEEWYHTPKPHKSFIVTPC